ncbi:MAG: TrkA family potassium uptake protein [bacterium]
MHIVVMGCGRVGSTLSLRLQGVGHSVAVIDQDASAFRRLGEHFTGTTVAGVGFDRDTLIEAGIERAEGFAAVSNGDNSNIIAARVARETFNVQTVVARIYDAKRAEIYERLGIPTIATVPWTANRLFRQIMGEAVEEAWRDPSGTVALLHVEPHEGWVGHTLRELEQATGGRVAMITRFGIGEIPTDSTLVQDGDVVHLLLTDERRAVLADVVANPPEA